MSQEDAKQRLLGLLPHLSIGMEMARLQVPGCAVELAIVGTDKNGSGQVVVRWDADLFFADLSELCCYDAADQTIAVRAEESVK